MDNHKEPRVTAGIDKLLLRLRQQVLNDQGVSVADIDALLVEASVQSRVTEQADKMMMLLQDAARAWNNENEPAVNAAMEEIECFLIDSRARQAALEAPTDDAKDAARYRFLRRGFGDFGPDVDLHNAFVDGDEKMDSAIDAAMREEGLARDECHGCEGGCVACPYDAPAPATQQAGAADFTHTAQLSEATTREYEPIYQVWSGRDWRETTKAMFDLAADPNRRIVHKPAATTASASTEPIAEFMGKECRAPAPSKESVPLDVPAGFAAWMRGTSAFPHSDDSRHPFDAFEAGVRFAQQGAAQAAHAGVDTELIEIGNRMATTLEVLACALKNPGTAEGVRRTVEEWRAAIAASQPQKGSEA